MLKKLMICGSFLALAACGGGDDDKGNGINPDTFVSGTFQDASVTGKLFPIDRETNGYYGQACVDKDMYFESERVRVYGSPAFSENDFKAMATVIEERLDGALAKLGLTWNEFVDTDRPVTTARATMLVVDSMASDPEVFPIPEEGDNPYDAGDGLDVWVGMTDAERLAYLEVVKQRVRDFNTEVGLPEDEGLEEYQTLDKEFVIGCLAPSMSGSTFGEGSLAGILMPPEYRQWPDSVGEIVSHEILHFAQNNLMRDAGIGYLAPRWFTEGQSVLLAGQQVASPGEHYNYEPQDVVSFFDEYGDPGMAYKHYGLAYKYINDHNSMESIVTMLRQMKETLDDPFNPKSRVIREPSETDGGELGDESLAWTLAFDANMRDHNGDPLTVDRFRNSYHDLMNAAY